MARRTCGYCGDTGHNHSTCPTEKKRVEEIRARDPDNWRVYEYDRRHQRRKESRLRASQDRKCSYCGEPGHNRRSCPTLKQHKHYGVIANAEARVEILEYLRKEGIGPGALMVIGERYYDQQTESYHRRLGTHLVAGMNWKALDFAYFDTGKSDREHPQNKEVLSLVNLRTGEKSHMNLLPDDYMQRKKREVELARETGEVPWGLYTAVIVSPAEAVEPPQGWLESRSDTHLLDLRFGGKGKKATTHADIIGRLEFDPVDQIRKRYEEQGEEI
jgi:hypothetical protein